MIGETLALRCEFEVRPTTCVVSLPCDTWTVLLPSQVLGIGNRRVGAPLASGLPVVQLPDADVLHFQPSVQGGARIGVVQQLVVYAIFLCARGCTETREDTDGCAALAFVVAPCCPPPSIRCLPTLSQLFVPSCRWRSSVRYAFPVTDRRTHTQ